MSEPIIHPYIYAVQDLGPRPKKQIAGGDWELELWDGSLCVGYGYDGFDIKSEVDYRALLAGLRELATELGWSEAE